MSADGGRNMNDVHSVQELIERTRDMPLEKMRFFINEDKREPRCFGIYHDDAKDRWVVYKNKADGSRAVRYSGPVEAYAANELWQKICSEIELRRPKAMTAAQKKRARRDALITGGIVAILIALVLAFMVHEFRKPNRGYYLVNDGIYYCQDSDWYWYDDGDWRYYDAPEDDSWYEGGYYGEEYPYFEDAGDAFEYSDYYEAPSEGDSDNSGVFDSWDSGDTDWSSDW